MMKKILQKVSEVMMRGMEKLTPTCEVISQKISRSIDEKISLKEKLQIKIHLLGCTLCERYRDQLLAIHKMMAKYSKDLEEELPDQTAGLSGEAAKRMKLVLKQQSEK